MIIVSPVCALFGDVRVRAGGSLSVSAHAVRHVGRADGAREGRNSLVVDIGTDSIRRYPTIEHKSLT